MISTLAIGMIGQCATSSPSKRTILLVVVFTGIMGDWHNPFNVYIALAHAFAQWGILIIVMIVMNNKLNHG